MTPSKRLMATVLNAVTQTSLVFSSSGVALGPAALLDGTGDGEDRQVHGDEEATDHAAQEHHQERFDHGGQTRDGGVDLVVIKVSDLIEHGVHGAGRFTDANHLDDHGWEHVRLEQGPGDV